MSVLRPIHHTFAPLADTAQCRQAAGLLFRPGQWKHGAAHDEFRNALRDALGGEIALFSSGREALLALLHLLGIAKGDEVIVQGFTCVVVPNAIAAAGGVPVYADIDSDSLSSHAEDVAKMITPKTKAVICQHTFGLPAPLRALRALCDEHRVILIEDCAHILPDADGPEDIGRVGDFALLSFGRDKAISGITGGAIVSRHVDVSGRLLRMEHAMGDLSASQIGRLLLYPLLYAIGRPLYGLGIGKAFLKLCGMLKLLVPILTTGEKKGSQPSVFHTMPNACAALALSQLRRLREINDHRRMLTQYYLERCAEYGWPVLRSIDATLPLQKFPMLIPGAERIRRTLRSKNIHLHDGWTGCIVCPPTVDASALGYKDGDDPRAEEACDQILSLPTHPGTTEKDARTLVEEVESIMKNTKD